MTIKSRSCLWAEDNKDFCAGGAKQIKRGFNKAQFITMALGNIIGSGIFLASSSVINMAGIWAPLAYLLGGAIMSCEVAFIVEMSVANPVQGSFKVHAQQIFGNWWGYMIGWMFWASGVLGMAGEVTACALFAHYWLPSVPLWILSLIFSLSITGANLTDISGISVVELWLASLKIATLVIFVFAGAVIFLGVPIGSASGDFSQFAALLDTPLAGFKDLIGAMIITLFAYTGTGIIGLAVTETKNAERTVPHASKIVAGLVTALYTFSAIIIIAIVPPKNLDVAVSPFVDIFSLFSLPFAPDIVNLVLISAALSALNSQVYSSSRMLLSLAKHKEAPKAAAFQSKRGVPVVAVLASGFVMLLTSMASYLLPEKIFLYTISASGVLALVNWMSVSATYYFYRRRIMLNCPENLKYKAPGYPYSPIAIFVIIAVILISAPLFPDQVPGLVSGGIILLGIGLSYFFLPPQRT